MKRKQSRVGQEGIAFLEVLFGVLILGIAVIGASLMLSRAQTMVVAQGDQYVALYLAQQKIENLIAQAEPPSGLFGNVATGSTTEPSLQAGESAGASQQSFTRTTCVNFVNDDDPTTPSGCTPCSGGGTCTNNTKRITVTVTPALQEANAVTLVAVITNHTAN